MNDGDASRPPGDNVDPNPVVIASRVGKHPTIRVQRNLDHQTRKVTTPKTKKGNREIDLSLQLRGVLRLQRRRQSREALAAGKTRPEWIFTNGAGNPLDVSNVHKIYKRILDKAGIRRRTIHDLRDTFATMLITQGEPLAYVSKQMGHLSIQVTVDKYSKWFKGENREAVDRLFAPVARTA